jgi:predicted nucleotidyltransferase component of viral defense system
MKDIVNKSHSIKDRRINISRETSITIDRVYLLYAQERLLFRVSQSKYAGNLVLKGGLFLYAVNGFKGRPTRDIDLLARKINIDNEKIKTVVEDICSRNTTDPLQFDKKSLNVEKIKEDEEYEGVRIKFLYLLDRTRIPMQIDIGIGDIVFPSPVEMKYPSLLDSEVNVYAYTIESVISEKFEAIIKLSFFNSRMKDFYDIYSIVTRQNISGDLIVGALTATITRRGTSLIEYNENIVLFR